MRETKNITTGIDVKLNKTVSMYHCIIYFINMRQRDTDPNNTFKFRFNNIYETMAIAGGDNILCIKKLIKNGNHASTKDKQAQIDQTKAM